MKIIQTKHNIQLSQLGFGAMNLPLEDSNLIERILDTAIDNGIKYIDTADLYQKGQNELAIGRFIKQRKNRHELTLLSKVGNEFNQHNDEVKWNPSKKYIMGAIKDSLSRLQTDYLDMYLLHGGMIEDNKDETIDAFETLKKEGLIRCYGISSIRPNVIDYYINNSNIDVIMMQFNLFDNRPLDILPSLEQNDIKLLARGPLSKGLLTDKYEVVSKYKFNDGFLTFSKDEMISTIQTLENQFHLPIQTIAMLYQLIYSNGAIVCGASKLEQLNKNIEYYHAANQFLASSDIESCKSIFESNVKSIEYEEHLV